MTMLQRVFKHFFTLPLQARRCFPAASLERIQAAIARSEHQHRGEIRFLVEHGLDLGDVLRGVTPRQRAVEHFSRLNIWDTEDNTGILVYVLLADRDIEILADRGINKKVPQPQWDSICLRLRQAFLARQYEQGVLDAIDTMTRLLVQHFPPDQSNPDELPNRPVLM